MQKFLWTLLILSTFASCGSSDEQTADDTDGIGVNDHRIFVTSTSQDGDYNGLTGADDICSAAATSASLTRSYKAIVSDDNTNAVDRLTELNIANPVYIVDASGNATMIVAEASDFWTADTTNILNLINRNESGALISDVKIWTGSDTDGNKSTSNCNDFDDNSSSVLGDYGDNSKLDSQWLASGTGLACNTSHHLYCISQ